MNNIIYKIKNNLFKISNEANKIKRPSYEELLKYQNFNKNDNNKLALGFGAGRSGQNWFSRIFNSHPNWIGTCERFADFEAFWQLWVSTKQTKRGLKKVKKVLERKNCKKILPWTQKVYDEFILNFPSLREKMEIVFPAFDFPQWTQQFVIILLFLGFPIAIVISWIFDKNPDGISKTSSNPKQKSLTWKIALASSVFALILYFSFDKLFFNNETNVTNTQKRENSIAVLPFNNFSKEQNDQFFSDGLTEDIITQLSKINGLKVISRTSVMEYKETSKKLMDIAEELNVVNILEGSVRVVGDKIRINAQLIDAFTDDHIWVDIPFAGNYEIRFISSIPPDPNNDGSWNVLDLVLVVNFIIGSAIPDEYEQNASDINQDGMINVLDLVVMVNLIVGN